MTHVLRILYGMMALLMFIAYVKFCVLIAGPDSDVFMGVFWGIPILIGCIYALGVAAEVAIDHFQMKRGSDDTR